MVNPEIRSDQAFNKKEKARDSSFATRRIKKTKEKKLREERKLWKRRRKELLRKK